MHPLQQLSSKGKTIKKREEEGLFANMSLSETETQLRTIVLQQLFL